ncbi:hypothetical protein CKO12_01525 [Chromatium okenii]|nr:hypothetical protein [Chromatium okenii]
MNDLTSLDIYNALHVLVGIFVKHTYFLNHLLAVMTEFITGKRLPAYFFIAWERWTFEASVQRIEYA